MDDDLTRAQHYQSLARQMRETAEMEQDAGWRMKLIDLAAQYEKLVTQILEKRNT